MTFTSFLSGNNNIYKPAAIRATLFCNLIHQKFFLHQEVEQLIAQGVDVNQQGGETKVLVQFVILFIFPNILQYSQQRYNTNSHLPT